MIVRIVNCFQTVNLTLELAHLLKLLLLAGQVVIPKDNAVIGRIVYGIMYIV